MYVTSVSHISRRVEHTNRAGGGGLAKLMVLVFKRACIGDDDFRVGGSKTASKAKPIKFNVQRV